MIAITKATGNFSQLVQEKLARSPESLEKWTVVEEIIRCKAPRRRGTAGVHRALMASS